MGFGSKVKKTAKKTTKTVHKQAKHVAKQATVVAKQAKKVANTPVVKTAVTAVATTMAGEAGAQMVNNTYSVVNSSNPLDVVLGSVSPAYLVTKGYVNQFTGKTSPLSTVLPSSNEMEEFSDESISYAGVANGLLQTANGINKTVKSAQGKQHRGLIAEILSWFGF